MITLANWYTYLFFFKQKTAYEMRISDWSSDVCSSDLENGHSRPLQGLTPHTPSDNFGYAKPSSIQSLGQCQNLAHQTPSLARQKTHLNPCLNGLPHSCGHRSQKIANTSRRCSKPPPTGKS